VGEAAAVQPRLLCVVGARPSFVKMAPVTRSLEAGRKVRCSLLHTGQHYDEQLSGWFLERARDRGHLHEVRSRSDDA